MFANCCSRDPRSQALARAEDLRVTIAELRIQTSAGVASTSASIGVVPVFATSTLDSSEVLGRADGAM